MRARTPLQLLELTHVDFDALLHSQPGPVYELVRTLTARLDEIGALAARAEAAPGRKAENIAGDERFERQRRVLAAPGARMERDLAHPALVPVALPYRTAFADSTLGERQTLVNTFGDAVHVADFLTPPSPTVRDKEGPLRLRSVATSEASSLQAL